MADQTPEPPRRTVEYRESSRANLALVLGSLGLLCLPPLSAAGFWLAVAEQRGIDQGVRDQVNRRKTNVALAIGGFGLAMWCVVLVAALLTLSLDLAPD